MGRLLVLVAFVILAAEIRPVNAEARTDEEPAIETRAMAAQRATPPLPARGHRDEAAMVLVGTFLIGVAAAVRRAA
jgi:hypothetical protein